MSRSATEGREVLARKDAELPRELGVVDLVLAQIVFVVGGTWVGTAARLGPAHLVYWLLASALFFVPLAAVVLFLNTWAPLEGGLYRWAHLAMGDFVGFLVGFNLWIYVSVLMSGLGLEIVTAFAYAIPRLAWVHTTPWISTVVGVASVGPLAWVATRGMQTGKRVQNGGSLMRIAGYAVLLGAPLVALALGHPIRPEATSVARPVPTLLSLNILGKMGFGAFSGFEYVAIFAGESRAPARSIARSVLFAAPLVVLMFVAGTSAVLAFVPPGETDLIAPIPQVLSVAVHGNVGVALSVAVSIAINLGLIAWASVSFSGIARLPMVAGWDGLLPPWFTRLDPKTKTPTNSIRFAAVVSIGVTLFAVVGVGNQEAFQLIGSASMILYALTYLVMFAIPFLPRVPGMPRASLWLRLACASGFAMTLLFIVLSLFPIVDVQSSALFSLKIGAIVVVTNVVGVGLFVAGKGRARGRRDAVGGGPIERG